MLEETTGPQLQTAQFRWSKEKTELGPSVTSTGRVLRFTLICRLSGVRPEEQTTSEQMMAPQMEKEGLGKFGHEGLHPLMECDLLFIKYLFYP